MKVFQCRLSVLFFLCFYFWMDLCVADKQVSERITFACEYPCECEKRLGNQVCASNYETFPNQCFLDLYNSDEKYQENPLKVIYDGPCTTNGKSAAVIGDPSNKDAYQQYEEADDSADYEDEYGNVDADAENYSDEIFVELPRPSKSNYPSKNDDVQPIQLVQPPPPAFYAQPIPVQSPPILYPQTVQPPQVLYVQPVQPPPVLLVQPNPYPLYPVVTAPAPVQYQQVPVLVPGPPYLSQPLPPPESLVEESAPVPISPPEPKLVPLGHPGIVISPPSYYPPTVNNTIADIPGPSNYSDSPSQTYSKPIQHTINSSSSTAVLIPEASKYPSKSSPVQPPVQQNPAPKHPTKYDRKTTKNPTVADEVETKASSYVPVTHPPVKSGSHGAVYEKNPPPSSPAPAYKTSTKKPASVYPPPPPVSQQPTVFETEPSTMIPPAIFQTSTVSYKQHVPAVQSESQPKSHVLVKENPPHSKPSYSNSNSNSTAAAPVKSQQQQQQQPITSPKYAAPK